jgi:shikimate dehydrogenase
MSEPKPAAVTRACIIGWPVAHSRSPLIHGYWLKRYGIAGSYTKQPVRPDDVVAFLRSMREEGFAGCNVTLPYKETAYAAATEKSAAARAMGAANTLWFEGEKLCADNTDGAAFVEHLRASVSGFDAKGCTVAVLGAGGAARAIIYALLEAGVPEVRIFNRTRERADVVAAHFGARVTAHDWRDRVDRSRGVGLLVNATSLGMKGADWLDMDATRLTPGCIVADLVYVPLETPLLLAARARGLRAVDGLGMLLHQAVPGFAKWFGVRPEVTDELRALVAADIEGH